MSVSKYVTSGQLQRIDGCRYVGLKSMAEEALNPSDICVLSGEGDGSHVWLSYARLTPCASEKKL